MCAVTQGLIAYYYDHIRPGTAVELNQCRYNHMGVDILCRNLPGCQSGRTPGYGHCRNGLPKGQCEDCMVTPMSDIYSVHYTMCRKPWQCMAVGSDNGKAPGKDRATAINTRMCLLEHCYELIKKWHSLRSDFEQKLLELTNDQSILGGATGAYRRDIFLGHCDDDGNAGYRTISASTATLQRIGELYGGN